MGKVGNCQIGVSVHAASDTASCPLSWRLRSRTASPSPLPHPPGLLTRPGDGRGPGSRADPDLTQRLQGCDELALRAPARPPRGPATQTRRRRHDPVVLRARRARQVLDLEHY
ncbi:hypothetical protein [Streptomyces sp. NPDC056400]|uniref:hypothetical protein n=1 Tax=unclassified Streptomyces TaxID=2593676 RepID=UPI0035DC0810